MAKGFSKMATAATNDNGIGVTIDDFIAYMPSHIYFFTPCREP